MLRGTPLIGVQGTVQISSDSRNRRFLLNRWTSPGVPASAGDQTGLMDSVLTAWLAGDDRLAAELFRTAIQDGLTGTADPADRRLDVSQLSVIRFWAPGRAGSSAAQMWTRLR